MSAKLLQHQVASGVPVGVVDDFEVVNVQLGNQQWRAAAQAAALLQLHAIEHGAAVEQAGQVIVRGQLADSLQRLRQFGLLAAQVLAGGLHAGGEEGAAQQHHYHHAHVGCSDHGGVVRLVARGHHARCHAKRHQAVHQHARASARW